MPETPKPPATPAPSGSTPTSPPAPAGTVGKENGAASSTPSRSGGLISSLKEVTATLIALFVVGATMYMLLRTFAAAVDSKKLDDMKDIMLYGLPILGSIIGYYFGRVPAERRAEAAETAQSEAQATAKEAQQAAATAQQKAADEGQAKSEAEKKLAVAKTGIEAAKARVRPQATAEAGGLLSGQPEGREPPASPQSLEAYYELEALSRLL